MSYKSSIHSEEMAIDKLPKNNSKKIIKVSLCVIRITKASTAHDYTICNSKPCIKCMSLIKNAALKKGYKINKIYFSNENNEIVCYKLKDLLKEDMHIPKLYQTYGVPHQFQ